MRLGTFGRDVTISPEFTRDPDSLRAELPERIATDAPTPLWRGVDEAITAFGGDREERRVVLVLSDGKDSGPISFRERPSSQAQIIDRARTEDVMIYAIGMRSRGARRVLPGIGIGGLQMAMTADLPDPDPRRARDHHRAPHPGML